MGKKMKGFCGLMLLLLASCVANAQIDGVYLRPSASAYPASEWSLMGMTNRKLEVLKFIMVSKTDSTWRYEWSVGKEAWKVYVTESAFGDEATYGTHLYLPPAPAGIYSLKVFDSLGGKLYIDADVVRADTVILGRTNYVGYALGDEGYLLDAVSGKPIPGAEVQLQRSEDEETLMTTTTDSMGVFRFGGLDNYKDYHVVSGNQRLPFTWRTDPLFGATFLKSDTMSVMCDSCRGAVQVLCVDSVIEQVATLHFEQDEFGVGVATAALSPNSSYLAILPGDDTIGLYYPRDAASDFFSPREVKKVSMKDKSFSFEVVDHSANEFQTQATVKVQRLADPHPWRLHAWMYTPYVRYGHSIDSVEFVRRFPHLVMDSLSRTTENWAAAGGKVCYEVPVRNGERASVDLAHLEPGNYRIHVYVPQPDGDTVSTCAYHYRTPGYADGNAVFYAYQSVDEAAVGDTLRLTVGSCYPGVTVMCKVMENGQMREMRRLELDADSTHLEIPLLTRGVTQAVLFSLWHGELSAYNMQVFVGRTPKDWYWEDLLNYESVDMAGQCWWYSIVDE